MISPISELADSELVDLLLEADHRIFNPDECDLIETLGEFEKLPTLERDRAEELAARVVVDTRRRKSGLVDALTSEWERQARARLSAIRQPAGVIPTSARHRRREIQAAAEHVAGSNEGVLYEYLVGHLEGVDANLSDPRRTA